MTGLGQEHVGFEHEWDTVFCWLITENTEKLLKRKVAVCELERNENFRYA